MTLLIVRRFLYILCSLVFLQQQAQASIVTIDAAENIYGAGSSILPGGGLSPTKIDLIPNVSYLTFGAYGRITINGGGNRNNPDGIGARPASSSNIGYDSISGIYAPGAGYLVGLFVGPNGPLGPKPAALNFTPGAIGTSFLSLAPTLDQTFFIGDGFSQGQQQTFFVPNGATELYLGISDAENYNGQPGSYRDNSGSYTVIYNEKASSVPEPTSLLLLIVSFFVIKKLSGKKKQPFPQSELHSFLLP
ncbi:hypothetical protein [Telmatospirillum sp.]|uniref:hypothetical protein n=1 Tax=Telmatospirillum sp. TaxID=2079197 RepID=UPI00284D4773|nr:hypothetical protein [Telmatospirillum sp.]MDR3437143.1 hypothetical protein [Telmatospirillum sp.]